MIYNSILNEEVSSCVAYYSPLPLLGRISLSPFCLCNILENRKLNRMAYIYITLLKIIKMAKWNWSIARCKTKRLTLPFPASVLLFQHYTKIIIRLSYVWSAGNRAVIEMLPYKFRSEDALLLEASWWYSVYS